jgi:hypothetical protein
LAVGLVSILLAVAVVALSAQAGSSGCRGGDPMANVRDPGRLKVLSRCQEASGVVRETRAEPDGDIDVFVRPDPGSVHLLDAGNRKWLSGSLLLEIIPADQPGCRAGQRVRYGTCTGAHVPTPRVGSQVTADGPHVYDTAHDHNEIHPVWRIAYRGQQPPPAPRAEAERPQSPTVGDTDEATEEVTDGAPAVGAPPTPADAIGLGFSPVALHEEFPPAVEHLSQILLVDPDWDPGAHPATHVVERVRTHGWDMLWLERYDVPKNETVRVVDAVLLPPRSSGEFFAEPGSCQHDGAPDTSVAAIVRVRGDELSSDVRHAWRFDRQRQAVTSLPTAGVACRLQAHD